MAVMIAFLEVNATTSMLQLGLGLGLELDWGLGLGLGLGSVQQTSVAPNYSGPNIDF